MYSFKHEQPCFIGVFYEFIGEVILKINPIWDVKTSEKFIKEQRACLYHI